MVTDKSLLDTNIVLYIVNGDDDLITFMANREIFVSVITEIELLGFPASNDEELMHVTHFIGDTEVYALTPEVKDCAIDIKRKYDLNLAVSIIAATSLVYGIQLISGDKDYEVVKGLDFFYYEPYRE